MAVQILTEGFDPDLALDLAYVENKGKVCLLSGDKASLQTRALEEGYTITESLEEVGVVKPLNEDEDENGWKVDKTARFVVEGPFQRWGVRNANNRVYPRDLFEFLVGKSDSYVNQCLKERRMTGHLEHPQDGRSNIKEYAILTSHLTLHPNKSDTGKTGVVRGRAELLETPNGQILRSLTRHRIPWGVSSRGRGTVDGEGNVKWSGKNESDDFRLDTFDAVSDPSTPGARPTPIKSEGTINTNQTISVTSKGKSVVEQAATLASESLMAEAATMIERLAKAQQSAFSDKTNYLDGTAGRQGAYTIKGEARPQPGKDSAEAVLAGMTRGDNWRKDEKSDRFFNPNYPGVSATVTDDQVVFHREGNQTRVKVESVSEGEQPAPEELLFSVTKVNGWAKNKAGMYTNKQLPGVSADVENAYAIRFSRAPGGSESITESSIAATAMEFPRTHLLPGESLDESSFKAEMKSAKSDDDPMEPLAKHFIQYIKQGNTYTPMGDAKLTENLGRHAYRISMGFSGPQFTKVKLKTDDLYHFKDAVTEGVLAEIDKFWGLKESYDKLGIRHARGILLYGPPGTGKSSTINQVVEMIVNRGDVVFYTSSVSYISPCMKAFREVEENRKVVIVLEDTDGHLQYNERELLNLMDGEDMFEGCLYLATTNYIDRFPPRLLRPGRFDKKIKVAPPSDEARADYLHRKLGKLFNVSEKRCREVAKQLSGLSFGHLKEYVASVYAMGEPEAEVIKRLQGERHLVESREIADANFAPLDESMVGESANEADEKKPLHGVFPWNEKGIYRKPEALAVKKFAHHAQAHADKLNHDEAMMLKNPRGYVVRPIRESDEANETTGRDFVRFTRAKEVRANHKEHSHQYAVAVKNGDKKQANYHMKQMKALRAEHKELVGESIAATAIGEKAPMIQGFKSKGIESRKPKLGSGGRFKALVAKLRAKGSTNPGALASWIGRQKYGAHKFNALAHHHESAVDEKSFRPRRFSTRRAISRPIQSFPVRIGNQRFESAIPDECYDFREVSPKRFHRLAESIGFTLSANLQRKTGKVAFEGQANSVGKLVAFKLVTPRGTSYFVGRNENTYTLESLEIVDENGAVIEEVATLDEKGIGRLFHHMDAGNQGYAILSADRHERSSTENKVHRKALEAHLRKMGKGFTHVIGGYIEHTPEGKTNTVREHSYFVPNMSRKEGRQLARHAYQAHGQESILHGHPTHGAHLIFHNGKREKVGEQASVHHATAYFTQYKRRKFGMGDVVRKQISASVGNESIAATAMESERAFTHHPLKNHKAALEKRWGWQGVNFKTRKGTPDFTFKLEKKEPSSSSRNAYFITKIHHLGDHVATVIHHTPGVHTAQSHLFGSQHAKSGVAAVNKFIRAYKGWPAKRSADESAIESIAATAMEENIHPAEATAGAKVYLTPAALKHFSSLKAQGDMTVEQLSGGGIIDKVNGTSVCVKFPKVSEPLYVDLGDLTTIEQSASEAINALCSGLVDEDAEKALVTALENHVASIANEAGTEAERGIIADVLVDHASGRLKEASMVPRHLSFDRSVAADDIRKSRSMRMGGVKFTNKIVRHFATNAVAMDRKRRNRSESVDDGVSEVTVLDKTGTPHNTYLRHIAAKSMRNDRGINRKYNYPAAMHGVRQRDLNRTTRTVGSMKIGGSPIINKGQKAFRQSKSPWESIEESKMDSVTAHGILKSLGIPRGADYHTLHSSVVDKLLTHARQHKYQKPANANGSRARYFHDMLQRQARSSRLGETTNKSIAATAIESLENKVQKLTRERNDLRGQLDTAESALVQMSATVADEQSTTDIEEASTGETEEGDGNANSDTASRSPGRMTTTMLPSIVSESRPLDRDRKPSAAASDQPHSTVSTFRRMLQARRDD